MEALGHLDEGLQFKQQALARNPQSPWVLLQIALSYWHQRKYEDTLVWTRRTLDLDAKHMLAVRLLRGVHWKRGDLESFLEENLRRATLFGVPDATLKHLYQMSAEMRSVYAGAGLCGLARYMADLLDDPRLELHFIDASDDLCKRQLRDRSKHLPPGTPWTTDAEFDTITTYFQPPSQDEAFNVVVMSAPERSDLTVDQADVLN